MIQKIILFLYFYLLNTESISAQNSFGLRAASFLRGILFGTAADVVNLRADIDYGEYNQKINDNYFLIVPENELKPQAIWIGENTYNWVDGDFLLGAPNATGWVQKNTMQIRGHNLVWAPDDFTKLSDYIHAVVGRYRGKILCWDVVNEAIDDRDNKNPLNLRDCFWLRKLGPDYIKYAFMFAHEADPNVQLYYNEYGIESLGLKTTRTINLINWLRSQGAIVHGVGLQWHIGIDAKITPGDGYYQSAQQFIDNKLDIMVTELDVAVPINDSYPINPQDLQTQANVYRSMLNYALHFSPNCKAMLTWGFTDCFSWIPSFTNDTKGVALPLDYLYMPKPAYWQMLDVMTRVVENGVYRLSPQSEPNKCLGVSQNTTSNDVQLYSGDCNNAYQKWNITWLGDGTYRFSSQSDNNRVLGAYNTTASVGGVQTYHWSGDVNQEWAFSSQGNNVFRVVIRTAWWRVMTVYGASDNIGIVDLSSTGSQNWTLSKV